MSEVYDESLKKKGRWTKEEQNLFRIAFHYHGKDWKKLSEIISTRNIVQIRSHAQKYCDKFANKCSNDAPIQKIYIVDTEALEALNQYISNTCANTCKKYMEIQQSLMYAQAPPLQYEMKVPETQVKVELHHA